MNNKQALIREAKLELARRHFYNFCKLKAPDFYDDERFFLSDLCCKLQDFLTNKKKVLLINMPPRHGKSRTVSLFTEWLLGNNHNAKIMTASYNEKVSTQFSKTIRNDIQEQKADKNKIVYSDVFPNTKIKRGDGASNLWSLEDGYNNYLATSPSGTATGFGASLIIIDDLIKNAEEANNEITKQNQYEWFTNTILSRLESNGKIIIIATRWSFNDLSGRVLQEYNKIDIEQVCYAACIDNKMLCSSILSLSEYKEKQKLMSPEIFEANYNQNLIDTNKRLYTNILTYDELPEINEVFSYTDVADKGEDFLCSIVFTVYNKEIFILDVLYTKQPTEITEKQTAKLFYDNKVNRARIESNNGGRIFARNVQRILHEDFNSNYTTVTTFTQTKNKISRILTYSSWIENHVYFPKYWYSKWPDFYNAITQFQREGKNIHDDAPDTLTGVVETTNLIFHIL